jgi:amino acid permease
MFAFLLIGTHQVYTLSKTEGFSKAFFNSYWIFMVVIILMIIHQIRKNAGKKEAEDTPGTKNKSGK